MKKDTVKIVVVFRKFKDLNQDVIALFPNDIVDGFGNCSSYQHVGQHGAAAYGPVMRITVAATVEESAALKLELEGLGYLLDVKKRHRIAKVKEAAQPLSEVNSETV